MRAGHQCIAFDVSPKAVEAITGEGATGANSFADLVRMADILALPEMRMDLETGPLTNQILLRQVDAAIGHELDARSGLSLKNTSATGDTLPTPAASPTSCQDSPSTGDEPLTSLET